MIYSNRQTSTGRVHFLNNVYDVAVNRAVPPRKSRAPRCKKGEVNLFCADNVKYLIRINRLELVFFFSEKKHSIDSSLVQVQVQSYFFIY